MKPIAHRCRHSFLLVLCLTAAMPAVAQNIHRVSPQKLQSYWILLNTKVDADVPNSGANLDKPGCVAVSYTIGSDGVPRDAKIREVVPQSDLGPVALSIIARLRYGPSLTNRSGEPVSTYYVVPFNAPNEPAEQQRLMQACQLPGYDRD